MNRKFIQRSLLGATAIIVLLVAVLGLHIYLVTKPKADASTVAMARIDIKQNIDESQAGAIENWLSGQAGVQHVVFNRASNIIIFTFYPVKASAGSIAENLRSTFNINAARFMPTAEQMQSGCPALSHTFSGKAYSFFSHIFNHN